MADGGDQFDGLRALADQDRAQLEISAFVQRHVQRDAAIGAARIEDGQAVRAARADSDGEVTDALFAGADDVAVRLAGRHHDGFDRDRPVAGDGGEVAVAPGFILAGGKRAHAAMAE